MLTADAGVLAMHRLVQAVTRTPEPGDPHRSPQAIDDARNQATRQLANTVPAPQDPAGWPVWRMLLPHIEALASHASPTTDTETTAYLLNETGAFLLAQSQPARAQRHFERALAGRQRVLGEDHPHTLLSRNNLAYAYREAGNPGRAIPLLQQALADSVRLLGEDHPDTLTPRNNLAGAYQAAGDLGRAIPLFQQPLASRVRVLGEDHPQALLSRNNLAGAYQEARDLGRAIPLHEQALADRVRALGKDHPDTLASRGNLAGAYKDAGDLGRAIPLFEQALAGCVRSWAKITLTPWPHVATSPAPTGRRGTWAGPSPCLRRPSPTACGSWATTTPIPRSWAATSLQRASSLSSARHCVPTLEGSRLPPP